MKFVQIFGRGGFSIMADFPFCHDLDGEKKFGDKPILIIYQSVRNFSAGQKKGQDYGLKIFLSRDLDHFRFRFPLYYTWL